MSPLDGTSWLLVGGHDLVGGAVDVGITVFFADGMISGSAGCNRFHGRYEVTDSQVSERGASYALSVGPLATTMMMCEPEVMDVERDVLQRLSDATHADVVDEQLLLGADDVTLLAFRAQRGEDLTGTWRVRSLHRPERAAIMSVTEPSSGLQLTLQIDADRVSGFAGCNTFNGRVQFDDAGVLRIGPVVSTMKACTEPEVMEQEQALFRALDGTVGYRLEGRALTLLRSDGGIAASLHRD
jgi:heat shock protein HslJ